MGNRTFAISHSKKGLGMPISFAHRILSTVFLMLASITLLVAHNTTANAEDCKTATFRTGVSNFMAEAGIGSVGFSFNSNPPTVQKIEAGNCYKIPQRFRGERMYLFFNHRTADERAFSSFLAVDILKQYKKLRFTQDRVSAVRKGEWIRIVNNQQERLNEVSEMKSFGSLSPQTFSEIHKNSPFDEDKLQQEFGDEYWHATPEASNISSLDRLSYWGTDISDNEKLKSEKYLIRFVSVPLGERPQQYKNGIPLNTKFHSDLEYMELHFRSPADGGLQTNFRLK